MLMKQYICFGICLPSKWFHLRLILLLFLNLGLKIAQNQYSHQIKPIFISIALWLGDDTPCAILFQSFIFWKGPGETPSAVRCLSYLINSFLRDVKQLAETSKVGHSPSSFCQKFPLSLFHFHKTLPHKNS